MSGEQESCKVSSSTEGNSIGDILAMDENIPASSEETRILRATIN